MNNLTTNKLDLLNDLYTCVMPTSKKGHSVVTDMKTELQGKNFQKIFILISEKEKK